MDVDGDGSRDLDPARVYYGPSQKICNECS